MIVLQFKAGPNVGQRIGLERNTVRIGGTGCNIVIVDPYVSNPHCAITAMGQDRYAVVDLGSKHGTRLGKADAVPITPHKPVEVRLGVCLFVGSSIIELSRPNATDSQTAGLPPAARAESTMQVRRYDPNEAQTQQPPRAQSLRSSSSVRGSSQLAADEAATNLSVPTGPETERDIERPTPPSDSDAVVVEALTDDEDPAEAYRDYEDRATFVFVTGPHVGRRVFLNERAAMVGRGDANQVVLNDSTVSLYHAQFVPGVRGSFAIQPLTKNDVVRVNSERITSASSLANGDIITIGVSEMRYIEAGIDMDAEDAGATIAVQDSFFAYFGMVRRQKVLTIGRSPEADLFLDDRRVERVHADLVFRYPDFWLVDKSDEGTYVNGDRVNDVQVRDGDAIDVGPYRLKVDLSPFRCSLDVVPPSQDETIPTFSADQSNAASYQTLYRLPLDRSDDAATTSKLERDKEKKNRSSVLWVEPYDVKRSLRIPMMIVTAVIMSTAVAFALARDGGQSFLRRPLGEGHRSDKFRELLAEKVGATDSCAACHGAFTGPVQDACATCHEGDKHELRPAHAKDDAVKMAGCTACHTEHLREDGAPKLIDGNRCASSGCHPKPHDRFFPQTAGPTTAKPTDATRREVFGIDLKADLAFTRDVRKTRIHKVHEAVDGKCGACHSVGDEEREEGKAWQACFTCHGPRTADDALSSLKCSDCHREHGEDAKWADAPSKAGGLTAQGITQLAFLLLLLPVGLVFVFHHAVHSRQRYTRDPDDEPKKEEGQLLCDGVELGAARRLPRLMASKCVGAADCVAACPYQVLEMVPGKPPRPEVARPELCHECELCVIKCGPGAFVMMEPNEPFPLVDRPAVDANYETSIPGSHGGVYVIGEAAAKPSVKNAINLGHWVVQHAAFEGAFPGAAAQRGFQHELVIVGSGPGGLSAALAAKEKGLSYVLLEKKQNFAWTVQGYPVGKRVEINPPHPDDPRNPELGDVKLDGPLWLEHETSREELLEKWAPQIYDLNMKFLEDVKSLKAERGGFLVETSKARYTCLRVILAPGAAGDPRRLDRPGEDLPKVKYNLDDPAGYKARSVMVVGGGNSAVEAAIALARSGAKVSLVYRKRVFTRATPKNRDAFDKMVAEGKITAYLETNVAEVREDTVLIEGQPAPVPNETLFCMLGAHAPTAWLKSLGIEMIKKSADWEPGPSDQPAFLMFGDLS